MDSKQRKRALRRMKSLKEKGAILVSMRRPMETRMNSYKIAGEPIDIPGISLLEEEDEKILLDCYNKIVSNPRESINISETMLLKYPDEPRLLSYITSALNNLKEFERANEFAEKNFRFNRQYTFARILYARACIRQANYQKIPDIFENHFDLNLAFPHRNVFQLSEFLAFSGVMIEYFNGIGNPRQAATYEDLITETMRQFS